MTYDTSGNMTAKTTPVGITESWTYDALNDVVTDTNGDGQHHHLHLQRQGRQDLDDVARRRDHDYAPDPTTGVDTAVTDPNGNTTTYAYNSAGELTSVTTPLGEETTYTYDAAGRRITMVDARGNTSGGTPSAHTTTYSYDALDRLTSQTASTG